MRFTATATLTVLLGALAGTSCEHAGEDRVLAVEAIALVLGIAYFDANGNRAVDASDTPHPGLGVRLVARGTRDTVAKVTSDANGAYAIIGIPVGDYRVVVDTTTLGDTIQVVRVDPPEIRLRPGDSVLVQVGVSFPIVSVQQARGLTPGRRVFVEGIALNSPGLFGDTTVHFVDASGVIRATRVRPTLIPVGAGDSLRLLGRRSSRAGQPVLDDVTVFFLGVGLVPPAPDVATAEAADARGGALDAALVRIASAAISDTATTARGDVHLTVDDGSGPLVVVLDADAGLATAGFEPGVVIEAIGVLVPTGAGDFRMKPRFNSDLVRQ